MDREGVGGGVEGRRESWSDRGGGGGGEGEREREREGKPQGKQSDVSQMR